MLRLVVPPREFLDEETNEIVYFEGKVLQLEHSLVSISKWEAKWHKAFLTKDKKTLEQTIDYIRCMTLTQNVDDEVFLYLSDENIRAVNKYIEDPMTATWFSEDKNMDGTGSKKGTGETVTSELIYYWMISLQIPVEFQKWHLNRLLTLIKVCNIKNTPPKKMSKRDLMNRNRNLNRARRNSMKSKG